MLQNYEEARRRRNTLATFDAALTVAQAAVSASSGGILGTGVGAAQAGVLLIGGLAAVKAGATIAVNNAETDAQVNAAQASYERRQQEWELQRQLAEHDADIGAQQIALAQTHTDIARQEQSIAHT